MALQQPGRLLELMLVWSLLSVHVICAGWSAAAYALVGRMDLAEMASAAAEAEAASRQAPAQALRPGPSMALGAASALEERAQAQGGARRPQLSPLWQPKLRTPAPGESMISHSMFSTQSGNGC